LFELALLALEFGDDDCVGDDEGDRDDDEVEKGKLGVTGV